MRASALNVSVVRADARLCLEQLVLPRLPRRNRRAGHSHADDDFRVAGECFRVLRARARAGHHLAHRLLRELLGGEADGREQACADDGGQAEHRVHQPDDQDVERHPGCVEQRVDAGAGEQRAKLADVAQKVAIRPARGRCGVAQHPFERGRRKAPVERTAGPRQRARARRIHEIGKAERDDRQQAQHDEGLDAAACEHAVEHLQHVERRCEQREVQHQARRACEQDERSQLPREQPTHGLPPKRFSALRGAQSTAGVVSRLCRFGNGLLSVCIDYGDNPCQSEADKLI